MRLETLTPESEEPPERGQVALHRSLPIAGLQAAAQQETSVPPEQTQPEQPEKPPPEGHRWPAERTMARQEQEGPRPPRLKVLPMEPPLARSRPHHQPPQHQKTLTTGQMPPEFQRCWMPI